MSRLRNDLFKREVINQRSKGGSRKSVRLKINFKITKHKQIPSKGRTERRKNIKKLRDIRKGRRWTIETTYIKLTFI